MLLDVGLPNLDGLSVLPQLATRGTLQRTRLIIVTLLSTEAEVLQAVLGALGGDAGTDVLVQLLGDEDAGMRRAAATALGRLGHWPAAPAVARLFEDGEWEVRRAGATALAAMEDPAACSCAPRLGTSSPPPAFWPSRPSTWRRSTTPAAPAEP